MRKNGQLGGGGEREMFGANCRSTVGLAMDGLTSTVGLGRLWILTSTVGPGQLWILTSTDGPPFLAMHKGPIFGSIRLANVLGIKLLLCL